ncbi:MAG TPA: hypothetical protein VM779_08665 [Thermoanaerobaculia bacterium]|nr:hypothetical protein [Thermoanaerobaculia bacterium]
MKQSWQIATAATFVFALVLTFPGFLPGRVLLPLDHPRDQGAWKPDPNARYEISNKIVSDPIYEYLAWDIEIRRLLQSGQLPWRNQWAGEGAHLYANPETALFFPFTWPRLLFGARGWAFTALLKLWAGGLGLWWLSRLLGADRRFALTGAAVYAASGYMTMWLLFPHTNVFAVLPWLAGSALMFLRAPSRRWATAVIIGAALATAGGHPETLFHGVICVAIFLLAVTWKRASPKRLASLAILAWTGFLLIAVQLVPFAVALSKSDIVKTRSAAESHRVRVFAAAAQLLPGFLGSPLRGELDLSGIAQPEAENFNERNAGYAGAITLLVIALAWRRLSRELRIGIVIGVATLIVAWKLPLIEDVIRVLPLFSIAANERFPLVFVLFASAALPAALTIVASDHPRRKLGIAIAAAGFTLAAISAVPALPAGRDLVVSGARSGIERMQERGFLHKSPEYYEERLGHYLEGLRSVALRRVAAPLALIGIAGVALAGSRRRGAVIGATIVAEMVLFAWGYAPAVRVRDGAMVPAAIADIHRLDPDNEFLIAASEQVYDANLATIHRLRDIRSYDVLQEHARIAGLAALGYSRESRAFPPQLPPESATGLAREGVKWFLSRHQPPGSVRVGGAASPAAGVYELPDAVPTEPPPNGAPAGITAGMLISIVALLGAVALVRLLPYHTL